MTMKPVEVKREILRLKNGRIENIEDSIVTEFPVTVKINGEEFVTMVCTPEYVEDMVIGFLAFVNDALTAKKMEDIRVRLSTEDCFRLMSDMQQSAATFHHTGGAVHNAALCDAGGIVLSRMDIGRHNALDKIYGYWLEAG
jgi:FdhD protein